MVTFLNDLTGPTQSVALTPTAFLRKQEVGGRVSYKARFFTEFTLNEVNVFRMTSEGLRMTSSLLTFNYFSLPKVKHPAGYPGNRLVMSSQKKGLMIFLIQFPDGLQEGIACFSI